MNKKIAITGATGLLGSHLIDFYNNLGWEVYVLVKDEHANTHLLNKTHKIYGNIDIKSDVEYFIQKSLPDYFVHLAAQTQAYDSLKYPYNTFYTNTVGTLNVLEALREYSMCKAIIVASSDKSYGELTTDEYTEDHPLLGRYPYDASKSITDILVNSYRFTYNLPVVTTRACNMYGIRDYNVQRLIPGILYAYANQSTFILRNNGEDIREYVHVKDVVKAYNLIFEHIVKVNDVNSFNISAQDRYSTMDVFKLIEDKLNAPIPHLVKPSKTREIKIQRMDSSLLFEKTNWIPSHTLETSLDEIIDWYLMNESKRRIETGWKE